MGALYFHLHCTTDYPQSLSLHICDKQTLWVHQQYIKDQPEIKY